MKASRSRIAQTIAQRLSSGEKPAQVSREVAAYLLAEGRVGELESLLRDVQAARAVDGQVEILAYSAHELSAAVHKDIVNQFKAMYPNAKNIIVTEVRDPAVIGGVRLELADRQLDLSVEAKLNKFKQLTV